MTLGKFSKAVIKVAAGGTRAAMVDVADSGSEADVEAEGAGVDVGARVATITTLKLLLPPALKTTSLRNK